MEHHFLRGARVYLSGPIDFVASRADEKKLGWRSRVADFLREKGAIVFDPWFKPEVRGVRRYGLEDWSQIPMDEREDKQPPQNPLLPFLERLTHELPQRWDDLLRRYVPNDDWLLWELETPRNEAQK